MKTCPRCHKARPDNEVVHTCVVVLKEPENMTDMELREACGERKET